MTDFHVVLTDHAITDLKSVSEDRRAQIHEDLVELKTDPFPIGTRIKRLRGFKVPIYRLRSGNFRVLYEIHAGTVTVLRIIDRKVLERVIKRLRI